MSENRDLALWSSELEIALGEARIAVRRATRMSLDGKMTDAKEEIANVRVTLGSLADAIDIAFAKAKRPEDAKTCLAELVKQLEVATGWAARVQRYAEAGEVGEAFDYLAKLGTLVRQLSAGIVETLGALGEVVALSEPAAKGEHQR
jgi:hypothetical protein